MDNFKFDEAPTREQVYKFAENYLNAGFLPQNKYWLSDKSHDFYLGMFAALRIFQSTLHKIEKKEGTFEDGHGELAVLSGELAIKILGK